MNLVIDAGNTRIKWGWFDARGWVTQHAAALGATDWAFGCDRRTPQSIMVSNVAGPEVAARIRALLPSEPQWLQPQAKAYGLTLDYDAGLLGADRYAALLACRAWAPCLVVSLGTAVTIDGLLREGDYCRHLGGLILPGRHTEITPSLSRARGGQVCEGWPRNTADALETGRLLAIRGAVEVMRKRLGENAWVLLSGGDGDWLRAHLCPPVQGVDGLVLEGLRMALLELSHA
jgi:type III pantothenate kinase